MSERCNHEHHIPVEEMCAKLEAAEREWDEAVKSLKRCAERRKKDAAERDEAVKLLRRWADAEVSTATPPSFETQAFLAEQFREPDE